MRLGSPDYASGSAAVTVPATRDSADHASSPAILAWPRRRARVPTAELIVSLALMALALALRLYRVDVPSLRGDEAFGFFFAQQPPTEMLRAMLTTEPHPPLFYLLFGGWMSLAGTSELSLRFFSVAFGVLSIPLILALGRRLFNPPAGLAAATILAIAPLQIWNSQDARMFTFAVATTLASSIILVDLICHARRRGPLPRRLCAAFGLLSLIGLFSLYHTAFVLIFQNLAALLWLRKPPRVALGWLLCQAAIAAVFLPWVWLARRAIFAHGGNGVSPGLWGGLRDGFGALSFGETVPPEAAGWLGAAFLVYLALATWLAIRTAPDGAAFAWLYAAVPALIVIGLALIRPVYQPRYLIAAQPGLALLYGAGLAALLSATPLGGGRVSRMLFVGLGGRDRPHPNPLPEGEGTSGRLPVGEGTGAHVPVGERSDAGFSPREVSAGPFSHGEMSTSRLPPGGAGTSPRSHREVGTSPLSQRERVRVKAIPTGRATTSPRTALGGPPDAHRRPLDSRRLGAGVLAALVALLVLGSTAYSLTHYWLDPRYAKATGWRDATDYIRNRFAPGDFVILNVPDPSFGYYFRDEARSAVLPERAPVDPVATGQALARLAADHPRLWLIPFQSPTWDADGFVEKWLERNTQEVERREFQNVRVRLYQTARPGLAAATPLAVSFEDGITLRAYRAEWAPTDAATGTAVLRLSLYWQADRRPSRDYTVFAHLESETGRLIAQQDNPPRQGTYPTSQWLPGEIVEDAYQIRVDLALPPGAYRLKVGLYDPVTGRRLLRPDGADAVTLEPVRRE